MLDGRPRPGRKPEIGQCCYVHGWTQPPDSACGLRPVMTVVKTISAAAALAVALVVYAAVGHASSPLRVFATATAPLYQSSHSSVVIGSITPGTALSVAATPAPAAVREKVTIEGWAAKGAETVIYQAPNLRIVLITLQQSAVLRRRVFGEQQDSYGTVWQHVKVSGWVVRGRTVPDVSTVWTAAKRLFEARCSTCHALHAPGEFTANQWPGILVAMVKNAALDAEQAALVTKYLQEHARAQ